MGRLGPRQVSELAQKITAHDRENLKLAVSRAGVNPSFIKGSDHEVTYATNIIQYMDARGKLNSFLAELENLGSEDPGDAEIKALRARVLELEENYLKRDSSDVVDIAKRVEITKGELEFCFMKLNIDTSKIPRGESVYHDRVNCLEHAKKLGKLKDVIKVLSNDGIYEARLIIEEMS